MTKNLSENRKAHFHYEILETHEAGIELKGFEVKAIKNGHMDLAGTFATLRGREINLINPVFFSFICQIKTSKIKKESL